jgi:hypothetical protein
MHWNKVAFFGLLVWTSCEIRLSCPNFLPYWQFVMRRHKQGYRAVLGKADSESTSSQHHLSVNTLEKVWAQRKHLFYPLPGLQLFTFQSVYLK